MDRTASESIRAFVIGDPISHSRSPLIHRYWLKSAGIKGSYDALHVRAGELADFVQALRDGSAGLIGGNVTIPHKEEIARLVDETDEIARQIGAVNTLWVQDGRIFATNTDSHGFAANLDDKAPGWDQGKTALVLGAGGASRAIIHALLSRGMSDVRIVNRTIERARELADQFGPAVSAHRMEDLPEVLLGTEVFVNTTSLGMGGTEVPWIEFTKMTGKRLVTDIVYTPLITPILKMAADQGLPTVDGLGMLLHQAAPGFEKWFGTKPVVSDELRNLIIADMEAH